MDFFRQWTICLCASLIVAVIFSVFEPKGNMKSFYRMMISVFVFISFLYPLKNIGDTDIIKAFSSIGEYSTYNNENYENEVNSEIKMLLKNEGIIGADVSSRVYVSNDNEIRIDEVKVAIPQSCSAENVENLLLSKFGIKAKVIYNGE